MDIFPYEFRPKQAELVHFIRNSVEQGRCAVVEAGTGMGKTVTSLCGTVPYALDNDMRVIYLTRTKSQQKQVVREAAALKADVLCIPIQGRSAHSCPMMRGDQSLASGTSEEISKLCSEFKRRDENGACQCPYYENTCNADLDLWESKLRTDHPEPEALNTMLEEGMFCPYEMLKLLMPGADVVAVPYPFVFVPQIFDRFVSWLGVPPSRMIVVVDEAHNLPDYLREVQTYEYSLVAMDLAEKEAMEHGDPEVHEGLTVSDFVSVLRETLYLAVREYLIDDDGMLPPYFMEDELMSRLGVTSVVLGRMFKAMEEIGDGIAEARKLRRKLPRSYIGSMARFLYAWSDCGNDIYVKLVVGDDHNPRFQTYCMDPSPAAEVLNSFHSSLHMSGTLKPLDSYVDELGLDEPVRVTMPGIFPEGNLRILYSDEVTMRYEDRFREENYSRLTRLVRTALMCTRVNTALFFPSYELMNRMVDDGILEGLNRDVYFERKGMPQSELMEVFDEFRMSEGSILLCILGGRISEGLDFPDKALELALILGIPYPKPTAKLRALRRYYDIRFGDGNRFTSTIPATRKIRQAIGRLIRSETDRGVAVVLDRRVVNLPDVGAEMTDDLGYDLEAFFSVRRRS